MEVQFYIAFTTLLWLADRNSLGIEKFKRDWLIWSSSLVALLWPAELVHTTFWQGGFIGFWYSFMTGVLCGDCLDGKPKSRIISFSYSLFIFFIGSIFQNTFAQCVGITGIIFCLILNASKSISFLSFHTIQKLGLISYSLYLFHLPITGIFMRVLRRFVVTSVATDVLAVVLNMTICIAIAAIAHILFERPAIAWSRLIKFKNTSKIPPQKLSST
ncbi:hypothetical protein DIC66_04590 [Rhodoferax lacus]|uniref:Acyltransferase 3 domain-containing protein n=1 Tax=Rhodoferax lacus TaxID=2184758 RepID=A0A3E1RF64_9BURK|nr:hypothetical protein DIC66_04590 [Rhodoferax lacus]